MKKGIQIMRSRAYENYYRRLNLKNFGLKLKKYSLYLAAPPFVGCFVIFMVLSSISLFFEIFSASEFTTLPIYLSEVKQNIDRIWLFMAEKFGVVLPICIALAWLGITCSGDE